MVGASVQENQKCLTKQLPILVSSGKAGLISNGNGSGIAASLGKDSAKFRTSVPVTPASSGFSCSPYSSFQNLTPPSINAIISTAHTL